VVNNAIITGALKQTDSTLVANTKVLLIEMDTALNSLSVIDSTFSSSNGAYSFQTNGTTVYIKAIPDLGTYPNLLPTYYTGSPVFQTATPVDISNCASQLTDITLINGSNPGGPGFIGGLISQGAGKQWGIGDPVPFLDLVLVDAANNFVTATKTDSDGHFAFSDLALGSYKIWVDWPNIDNSLAPVITLGSGQNESRDSLVFKLHATSLEQVYGVGIAESRKQTRIALFPNPTDGMATIEIEGGRMQGYTLRLFSLNGREMFTKVVLPSNRHQETLDFTALPKGMYILKIQGDDAVFIRKMAVH